MRPTNKFKEAIPAYQAVLRSTEAGNREHANRGASPARRLLLPPEPVHRGGARVSCLPERRPAVCACRRKPPICSSAPRRACTAKTRRRRRVTCSCRRSRTTSSTIPKHESFYEGAFRWGEILQAERQLARGGGNLRAGQGSAGLRGTRRRRECSNASPIVLSNPPKDARQSVGGGPARAGREGVRPIREGGGELPVGRDRRSCAREPRLAKAMTEAAGPAPRLAQSLDTLARFREALPRGDRSPSARRSAAAGGGERPRPLRRCGARCGQVCRTSPAESRIRRPAREDRAQLPAHLRRSRAHGSRQAPEVGEPCRDRSSTG